MSLEDSPNYVSIGRGVACLGDVRNCRRDALLVSLVTCHLCVCLHIGDRPWVWPLMTLNNADATRGKAAPQTLVTTWANKPDVGAALSVRFEPANQLLHFSGGCWDLGKVLGGHRCQSTRPEGGFGPDTVLLGVGPRVIKGHVIHVRVDDGLNEQLLDSALDNALGHASLHLPLADDKLDFNLNLGQMYRAEPQAVRRRRLEKLQKVALEGSEYDGQEEENNIRLEARAQRDRQQDGDGQPQRFCVVNTDSHAGLSGSYEGFKHWSAKDRGRTAQVDLLDVNVAQEARRPYARNLFRELTRDVLFEPGRAIQRVEDTSEHGLVTSREWGPAAS